MKQQKLLRFVFLIVSVTLFQSLTSQAFAQTSMANFVGVKTGYTMGTFTGHELISKSATKSGFQTGVFGNFDFSDIIGVSAELSYLQTGAVNIDPQLFYSEENKALGNSKIINSSISIRRLTLPVMVNFSVPGILGSVQPKVYVGGDIGYTLDAKALNTREQVYSSGTVYQSQFEDMGDRLVKFDFGAVMGTGINIIGNQFVYSFDVRYRIGLKNINNTDSNYVNSNIQTNTFSVLFGVAYKL